MNRPKKAPTAEVLPRRLPDVEAQDATDVSYIYIDIYIYKYIYIYIEPSCQSSNADGVVLLTLLSRNESSAVKTLVNVNGRPPYRQRQNPQEDRDQSISASNELEQ